MLTLELIREHCRLGQDETDEDKLLTAYGRAAWKKVETSTGRKLFQVAIPADAPADSADDEGYLRSLLPEGAPDSALPVTADIELAMLMLVAYWFKNREAVSEATASGSQKLPLAFDALIGPYRWFTL